MRANTSSEVCIQEICHLRNSSIETLSPRVVHQIISRFDISSVRSGIEPLRTLENVEQKTPPTRRAKTRTTCFADQVPPRAVVIPR
jgi:hypothetical protein